MYTIRVFIADDHHVVVTGLAKLFEEHNRSANNTCSIEVVGHALSVSELMHGVTRPDVDVFITDLGFDSTKGDVSVITDVLEVAPNARLVVFSMRRHVQTISACYKSGVMAYVRKNDEMEHLIRAICAAARGEPYYVPKVLEQIAIANLYDPLGNLGEREKRLFLLLAQETDISKVENELGISEKTINNIVTNKIKPVLGITRRDFRPYAIKMGLIE